MFYSSSHELRPTAKTASDPAAMIVLRFGMTRYLNRVSLSAAVLSFLTRSAVIAILTIVAVPLSVAAQTSSERFEVGVHVATATSGEFDKTDVGIGGRIGWLASDLFTLEGELTHYPSDYPDGLAFSSGRWEGLFGVTVGKSFDRFRPFAKLRPGFLSFSEAPEPFACIAIFPPPLACTLASGTTVFALDAGGGVDVTITPRTFLRFDVSDQLLRFEGPVFDAADVVRDESFFTHNFRFTAGGGWRF